MDLAERLERRELDDRFDFTFEQDRQHDDVARWRFTQSGSDLDVVVRHVGQQDRFLLQRRLADQSFTQMEPIRQVFALLVRVTRDQTAAMGSCLVRCP